MNSELFPAIFASISQILSLFSLAPLSCKGLYEFELETAFVKPDLRFDYQELRFIAIGYIQQRLYVLVFTPKHNEIMRVISLRKANKREVNLYEKHIKNRS